MDKESLDKYSKISIIVIAVISVISFLGIVYSKVLVPYQKQLIQEKREQEYFKASIKRQENQSLLDKCYADAYAASDKRRDENCTTKPGDSTYFYCSTEFIKSNFEIKHAEIEKCEQEYPLN